MNDPDGNLAELGNAVRDALGEPLDAARRGRQRVRLVESVGASKRHRTRLVRTVLVGVPVLAVLAVALGFSMTPPLVVRGTATGRWESSPQVWRFTDGSSVELGRTTRARLASLEGREVRIVLAEGELVSEVEPRSRARWHFEAGPYTVTVVGTRLGVRWSSETGHFEVPVWRGRVAVQGGALGGRTFEVGAGERLVISEGSVSLRPIDEREPSPSEDVRPSNDPVDARLDEPVEVEPATVRLPPTRTQRRSMEQFRTLAQEGHHAEALATLGNPARLLSHGAASDVVLLGDTARRAGNPALAERAYRNVRDRFVGTAEAADASFRLARLYADRGRHVDAATGFEAYLRERPDGPLAPQARGRALESWRRAGRTGNARTAAEVYLTAHPTGPYRELAQEVLRQP